MFYELTIFVSLTFFTILAFTNYRYAVLLLAALLPTYLLRLNIFGIPTTFLEIATWLTLLAGISKSNIRESLIQQWRGLPLFFKIFLFLFITFCFFSVGFNPTRHSLGILKGWVISPLLWGFIMASFPSSTSLRQGFGRRSEEGIYQSLLASGLIVSLIGLFQIFSLPRITSLYDVPNSLALFLVPLIILAVCDNKVFNKVAAFFMFVALLATRSVGGIAALIVTILLAFPLSLYRERARVRVLGQTHPHPNLLPFIFVISFLFFLPRFSYFLHNPLPTSWNVRQQLWAVSFELIKQHPLLGIGLGQFEPAYQAVLHQWFFERRSGLLPEFVFRDPHNWILSFWLNTGLMGLVSFVGMHVVALYPLSLYRERARVRVVGGQDPHPNLLPIQGEGTALALVALLLFGLVDTMYWKNDLASLHWFLLFSLVMEKAGRVD